MKIVCNRCIESHPWAEKYKTTLKQISESDYPRKNYFKKEDISALDADLWETDRAGNNDSTMDAVIGMCEYDGCNYHATYLLLAELRLDYESDNNLSFSSLSRKVSHTSDIIRIPSCRIMDEIYFVFTEKVQPQARHKFAAWERAGKAAGKWIAITPANFEILLKSEEDVPYQPIHPFAKIEESLAHASSGMELYDAMDFWSKKLEHYKLVYNWAEAAHIATSAVAAVEGLLKKDLFEIDEVSEYFIADLLERLRDFSKNCEGRG